MSMIDGSVILSPQPLVTVTPDREANGIHAEEIGISDSTEIDSARGSGSKRAMAVCVRNAYKHYGPKKHPNNVLQNLNLTVAKGSIYGLLGASGCGKTTLLACLVGRKHLDSGDIWVLGGKPGTRNSGIPGRRVGYMPQEIALFAEFSIRETMMFFGWIFNMTTKKIEERLEFLLKFLDLPCQNRLVKNLSGGQQRRVSFAAALMHDPELIILDEPTVGVDPLLRQSIWNYLVQLTNDGNKTVIITTHYIEEARQAHCIGLMRSGKLLAEASPATLLVKYQSSSLEDVFLLLSRIENNSREQQMHLYNNGSDSQNSSYNKKIAGICETEPRGIAVLKYHQSEELDTNHSIIHRLGETKSNEATARWNIVGKMRALLKKNFVRLLRNIGVLFIIFALPIIIVITFCLAVGRPPVNLHLAVVNEEINNTPNRCPLDSPINFQTPSTLKYFSCHYLDMLPKQSLVIEYYENIETAIAAVENGKSWGVLHFPPKFSHFFARRVVMAKDVTKNVLEQSTIRVWLDASNQQIGLTLQRDLQYAFRDFGKWLLHEFAIYASGRNYTRHFVGEKIADLPLQQQEAIYGKNAPGFQDFVSAGVILTIVFFLAVSLTSAALIVDRAEGLQDRSWVAGVSPAEILMSHVVTQFIIMCSQSALVLVFMFLVFGIQCEGNLIWIILITILQGLNGMSFGVIWPVEGMGIVIRYISYALPLTLATSSLRCILSRGWSIEEPDVYWGFIASLAWITFFLTLSFILMKNKRN